MKALEANIDGLVGPTHNYAGLSFGNVASQKNALSVSNPKKAALQGLQKMKFLHDLGIPQMVMPPHPRPDMGVLRRLGFYDLDAVPEELLHQMYSSSAMWAANAATISPGADTADGKVHITPANLLSKFHRAIETPVTAQYLKRMFPGQHFVHHAALPAHALFADEGAANHMRLCTTHGEEGTEIFVYGGITKKYPARQQRAASEAITRLHGLKSKRTVFLEQNPEAIDAGVFHNDVIAMSNEHVFVHHAKAYKNAPKTLSGCTVVTISEKELPLRDAVATYFFNSQLVTLPQGGMMVIAPMECEGHKKAKACFDRLLAQGHVQKVHYLDVQGSMKNGGGPACLRLRIVLTEKERRAVHPHVWLNEKLYASLCQWIKKGYRDKISPGDLRDPLLLRESQEALTELLTLIKMPDVPE